MNKKELVKALSKVMGAENVLSSAPDLLAYSYDALNKPSFAEAVVFAGSAEDVSATMKLAHQARVPVVPRGAGTNLTGGTVAKQGGIILELSRLNRVLGIDAPRHRIIVEPGIINLDLQNILQPLGFTYAPDPASQKASTLGGNLGEDAGGPHCLKYGVTHNHILGAELVLADGRIVQVGTATDDSYGYDLIGLLVGSEGTLGIATRITLRMIHLPESYQTMLVIFETLEDAGQAVSDIIAAGIVPAALELLDKPMIGAIEAGSHAGYPLDAEALLLIELDVVKEAMERQGRQIVEICQANNAREVKSASTTAERDVLWSGRRGAFGAIARVSPAYSVQDITVPRNKLMPMLREIGEIGEKHQLSICNVAHAGDGNLHPLILYDNRNEEESHRAEKAGKEILAASVNAGGTITGEHGVGIEKQTSMPLMFSPGELELMRQVKKVFDPEGILNPGKLIPPQEVIPEVRKDKAMPEAAAGKDKSIHDELASIVGADNMLAPPDLPKSFNVAGVQPVAIAFPSEAGQISEIVAIANRERMPIIPWGNGSRQAMGPSLAGSGIVLCLKRMNHVIELDASNLTAVVEAGIGHAELKKELAKHGLRFPLEPEDMEQATIGGSLASNSSGPGRLLYGTARDLVLGVTVVVPNGEIISSGIKTMKNVAGYDMRKIFFGSWGTLGVITRAVLKLSYLPEDHKTILLSLPNIESVAQIERGISSSPLRPESMELMDYEAILSAGQAPHAELQKGELLLLIGVAGSKEEVERHAKDIQALAMANDARAVGVLSGSEEEKAWDSQRRIKLSSAPGMVRGKAAVPIDKMAEMYQTIERVAATQQLKVSITGRAGNGILYASIFPEEHNIQDSQVLAALSELVRSASKLGGFFMVEKGPVEMRQAYDPLRQRSDYELMKRLKRAFDPRNIFNPGKLVRDL